MSKKTLTPSVRFNSFSDLWKQDKLGNHVIVSTGECVTTNQTFESGYPIISGGKEPMGFLNRFNRNENTVTVARAGTAGYVMFQKTKFYLNDKCFSLENDKSLVPLFLYYYLKANQEKIESLKVASSVPTINTQHLKTFDIIYPEIPEQKMIGGFLDKLDEAINLYEVKSEKLVILKKSLSRKMFPLENENSPKLRFKEYTGNWINCKLGDVIKEFYNGQTPYRNNKTFWNGSINWLSSGELTRGFVDGTIEKITTAGMKDANLKIIPKGTFVIAITGLEAAGTRGNCGILNIDTTMNQSCMALFPYENKSIPSFLIQWYHTVSEEYGQQYTQGTKQQSYTADILKKLPIIIPSSIEEQKKIGDLFGKIDILIHSYKQKLVLLKNLKASLLEKMIA